MFSDTRCCCTAMVPVCDIHALDVLKNLRVRIDFLHRPKCVSDTILRCEMQKWAVIHVSRELANEFVLSHHCQEHRLAVRPRCEHVFHSIKFFFWSSQFVATNISALVIFDIDAAHKSRLPSSAACLSIHIQTCCRISGHQLACDEVLQIFLSSSIHSR